MAVGGKESEQCFLDQILREESEMVGHGKTKPPSQTRPFGFLAHGATASATYSSAWLVPVKGRAGLAATRRP